MGGHKLPTIDTMKDVSDTHFEKQVVPPLGSVGGDVWKSEFNPDKPLPKERNLWERYQGALSGLIFAHVAGDPDCPDPRGYNRVQKPMGWREFFSGNTPMMPDLYRDPYLKTSPCCETYQNMSWRVCRYRKINPKIPPPVDGKFNDIYHYLAYKHWYRMERDVYLANTEETGLALTRCWVKEGINSAKNCRPIFNKYWALTRMDEQNQALMYMAVTGNNAIRETPYPEDFIEQKRKIYDDWLFRSRMKKPGDPI